VTTHLIPVQIPEGERCWTCAFFDGSRDICRNPEHPKTWNFSSLPQRPQWCRDKYDGRKKETP
jgi:hypothetical protein